MTTLTRNLSQINGANVPPPTQNGFSASSYEVYANDAAYEAVHPGWGEGAVYYNSTENIVREFDGTNWVYSQQGYNAVEDSVSTGTDQEIDTAPYNIVRFTEGSLTSIRGLDPTMVKVLYLSNEQGGQAITLKNEDGGATAGWGILTGTGDDLLIEDGQTLPLVYDGDRLLWIVAGGAGSGSGGLSLQVITNADSPVTAEIGKYYLTDTTGGPIVVNLPEISTIPPSQLSSATIRFADCAGNWHISNVSVVSGGADTQNYPDGTSDTDIDLNVQGQNNEFSVDSATSWCMTANFQPIEASEASGSGGINYFANGDFNGTAGTTGWSKTGDFSALSIDSVTQLEGDGSLAFTMTATAGSGLITGDIDPIDPVFYGRAIGYSGNIKVTGTGTYTTRLYNVTQAALVPGTEYEFTATAAGDIFNFNTTIIGTADELKFHIEDTGSGVSSDAFICDLFQLDPEGNGQGSVNGWPSYDETEVTLLTSTGAIDSYSLDLTPIKDHVSGKWRLSGNINVTFTAAQTTPSIEIVGSVFASTSLSASNEFYMISGSDASVTTGRGYINSTTNRLRGINGNVSQSHWSWTFDAPLTGKPTWATKSDLGVQLLNAGTIYQNAKGSFQDTSGQVIPNTTFTPLTFNQTIKDDTLGQWDGTRFTAGRSGFLEISCSKEWTNAFSNSHFIAIYKNTSTELRRIKIGPNSASAISTTISVSDVYLLAGEYVEVQVFQQEGLSRSFNATGSQNFIDINWQPDSTGNQPVGAGTSLLANETEQYLIPELRSTSVSLNSGSFGGGFTLHLRKIDGIVIGTASGIATHSSAASVLSAVGLVPEAFRPSLEVANGFWTGGQVQIKTDGQIQVQYDVARGNTGYPINFSYVIV